MEPTTELYLIDSICAPRLECINLKLIRISTPRLEKPLWSVFFKTLYLEIISNLNEKYRNTAYDTCICFTQSYLLTFCASYFGLPSVHI